MKQVMKKNRVGFLLMSSVVLSTMFSATVQAADVGSVETDVNATFTPGTSVVPPVDPTDPTKPEVDPGNPGTGNQGPLAIIYATNLLDFGTHEIPIMDATYTSAEGTSNVWNGFESVQISDARGGALGWKLSVKADPLKTVSNGDELKGAELEIGTAAVATNVAGANPAAASAVRDAFVGGVAVTAPGGDGAGITVVNFNPADIKLHVKGGTALAEAYTTKLVWTLNDSPTR